MNRRDSSSDIADQAPCIADDPLSAREREIVRAIVAGLRPAEIAVRLGIARKTVETHLDNVYAKLGVHTRHDLIGQALRLGIV